MADKNVNFFEGEEMNSKLILRTILLLLLGVSLLWAGDPWKEKSWREWTREEVTKITQDSPWAHSHRSTVGRGPAVGTVVTPPDIVVPDGSTFGHLEPGTPSLETLASPFPRRSSVQWVVQWVSALTLRQAIVREGQLHGTMTLAEQLRLPNMFFQQYVIVVKGSRVHKMLSEMEELTEELFRESVYLKPLISKREIHPVGTQVDASRRQVTFYFPRELDGRPVIGSREKKVEFRCVMSRTKIRTTFDLSKMVRNGKPDL